MKTKIIGIILIASSALTVVSCANGNSQEDTKEEVHRPLVHLESVKNTRFTHEIRVQGNIETDQDVTLSAEMGGLITSIDVREGQRVSQGQVIARVDASVLSSNMQELQTQLEYAEYMLGKQEELKKRGVGSDFDLETAKNRVNSLKASMNSLNTQRGKAVIRAPFSGVIDRVFARDGQMAGPASPIVRLVNNNEIDVVATVSEKHFFKLKVGTPIRVTFPDYSDTVVNLQITIVGNYIEPTNRTFRIMSNIKKNTEFLPNMLAQVSITDMDVQGLVIPSAALLKDQKSNDFIYVATLIDKSKNEYRVSKKIVKVTERQDGKALIDASSGLKEGAQVVVEGARGIAEGDIVRINK